MDFINAIKKNNKFKKVIGINSNCVIYERYNKLFVIIANNNHVEQYIKTGKWLSKITFRHNIATANIEQRLYLIRRLCKVFGKKDGCAVMGKIDCVIKIWHFPESKIKKILISET
jgi:hypothetical protein